MVILDRLELSKDVLIDLCQRHQVRELALFGSILRDDFREDSDIDVLVELERGAAVGLFEFVNLKDELAALLGREVDLVSKGGLHQYIQEQVLDSAETIYTSTSGYREPRRLDGSGSRAAVPVDRDLLRLHVAEEACAGIAEMIDGADRDRLAADDLRRSAALFELHRLGETLKRLSPDLKARHPDIPWQQVVDTGLRTVADYRNTKWDEQWEIMATLVPKVHECVCLILATQGSQPPRQ